MSWCWDDYQLENLATSVDNDTEMSHLQNMIPSQTFVPSFENISYPNFERIKKLIYQICFCSVAVNLPVSYPARNFPSHL